MITEETKKLFEAAVASAPFNNQVDLNYEEGGDLPVVDFKGLKQNLSYGAEEGITVSNNPVPPTKDKRTAAQAGGLFGKELKNTVADFVANRAKRYTPEQVKKAFLQKQDTNFSNVAEEAAEGLAATAIAKEAAQLTKDPNYKGKRLQFDSNLVQEYLKIPYVQDIGEAAKKAYDDKLPADYGVEQKPGEPTPKQKKVEAEIDLYIKRDVSIVSSALEEFEENLKNNVVINNIIERIQINYNKLLFAITKNTVITKNQQEKLQKTLDSLINKPKLLNAIMNIDLNAKR